MNMTKKDHLVKTWGKGESVDPVADPAIVSREAEMMY